mmetsp:Transcript_18816/g.39822  ORF Transcript_18816/g.39822 Transcript_18816/m.39822 type:complete len:149 (+) Transcript_18816:558-1004(+)
MESAASRRNSTMELPNVERRLSSEKKSPSKMLSSSGAFMSRRESYSASKLASVVVEAQEDHYHRMLPVFRDRPEPVTLNDKIDAVVEDLSDGWLGPEQFNDKFKALWLEKLQDEKAQRKRLRHNIAKTNFLFQLGLAEQLFLRGVAAW